MTPPLVPYNFPNLPGANAGFVDRLFAAQADEPSAKAQPADDEAMAFTVEVPEDVAAALATDVDLDEPPRAPAGPAAPADDPTRWGDWARSAAVVLWLAGAFSWLALAAVRVARFHRLLRHGRPAPAELRAEAAAIARRLGLPRCPQVLLVPGAVSPMLWALFGPPRLLAPADLLERLGEDQRATLLAHELAHLRRRDHWVRGLEIVATALYWWHPVVWWARHELRQAEEQCCDAWVVWALPRSARAYATALLETVDFLSDVRPVLPPVASGIGHVTLLKRRLTMIMQARTPRALSWVGFLGVLGLGAVLLPAWVEAKPSEPEYEQLARQLRNTTVQADVDDLAGGIELELNLEELDDLVQSKLKGIQDALPLKPEALEKLKSLKVLGDKGDLKSASEALRKLGKVRLLVQAGDDPERMRQLERALRESMRGASDEDINRVLDQVKKLHGKQPKKQGKEASSEDMEKARAQLKQAQDQMRKAQEQIREAARQLAEAHRRMAQLGAERVRRNIVINLDDGDGKGTGTGAGKGVIRVQPGEKKSVEKKREIRVITPPKPPSPPAGPLPRRSATTSGKMSGDSEQRIRQLEDRLSDLLNEVKTMRRELRQQNRREE